MKEQFSSDTQSQSPNSDHFSPVFDDNREFAQKSFFSRFFAFFGFAAFFRFFRSLFALLRSFGFVASLGPLVFFFSFSFSCSAFFLSNSDSFPSSAASLRR